MYGFNIIFTQSKNKYKLLKYSILLNDEVILSVKNNNVDVNKGQTNYGRSMHDSLANNEELQQRNALENLLCSLCIQIF